MQISVQWQALKLPYIHLFLSATIIFLKLINSQSQVCLVDQQFCIKYHYVDVFPHLLYVSIVGRKNVASTFSIFIPICQNRICQSDVRV